jgi:uncharacterized membrane protein YphA (DoxX/SURF4 family)
MREFRLRFERLDRAITGFMARYSITLLRISVGVVFLWFGVLKFFPGLSPAEGLATDTIQVMTFGLVAPSLSVRILGLWETVIGLGLLTGWFLRATLFLLFLQMMGAMAPLVLLPSQVFTRFPYALTLEGQYIVKNLVLISAGLVVGATVRGGRLVVEGERVEGDAWR